MAQKIHYTKEMKECPYCGNDEFYIRQSYSGTCKQPCIDRSQANQES